MAALRAETDKVAHIESTIGMFTKCCQVYLIHLFNLKAIKVNQRETVCWNVGISSQFSEILFLD